MRFLSRTFAPEGLGAELSNRSWLHPLARMSHVVSRGFVWNPTAGNLPPSADDARVYVHVVLAGRAVELSSGAALGPGDALVAPTYRATFASHPLALASDHRRPAGPRRDVAGDARHGWLSRCARRRAPLSGWLRSRGVGDGGRHG